MYYCSPLLWGFVAAAGVISAPLAWLTDRVEGSDRKRVLRSYQRKELTAFLRLHVGKGGDKLQAMERRQHALEEPLLLSNEGEDMGERRLHGADACDRSDAVLQSGQAVIAVSSANGASSAVQSSASSADIVVVHDRARSIAYQPAIGSSVMLISGRGAFDNSTRRPVAAWCNRRAHSSDVPASFSPSAVRRQPRDTDDASAESLPALSVVSSAMSAPHIEGSMAGSRAFSRRSRSGSRRRGDSQHSEGQQCQGTITAHEARMLEGALTLAQQCVSDEGMVPIARVFMLSTDDVLTVQLIQRVAGTGHSRIPVCVGRDRNSIVGLLLVKLLLRLDGFGVGCRVGSLPLIRPLYMPPHATMLAALHAFEGKRGHMALICSATTANNAADTAGSAAESTVSASCTNHAYDGASSIRRDSDSGTGAVQLVGIVTLEDCLLRLLNRPQRQVPVAIETQTQYASAPSPARPACGGHINGQRPSFTAAQPHAHSHAPVLDAAGTATIMAERKDDGSGDVEAKVADAESDSDAECSKGRGGAGAMPVGPLCLPAAPDSVLGRSPAMLELRSFQHHPVTASSFQHTETTIIPAAHLSSAHNGTQLHASEASARVASVDNNHDEELSRSSATAALTPQHSSTSWSGPGSLSEHANNPISDARELRALLKSLERTMRNRKLDGENTRAT